jgi:hypothetical protein
MGLHRQGSSHGLAVPSISARTHTHARTHACSQACMHGHMRVPSISTRILVISSMIEGLLQNHQHPYLPTRADPAWADPAWADPAWADPSRIQAAAKQHPAHAQVLWPSLASRAHGAAALGRTRAVAHSTAAALDGTARVLRRAEYGAGAYTWRFACFRATTQSSCWFTRLR